MKLKTKKAANKPKKLPLMIVVKRFTTMLLSPIEVKKITIMLTAYTILMKLWL